MLSEQIRNGNLLFYGLGEKATEEQLAFVDACTEKFIVFLDSVAGGGKTTWAVAMAHYLVHQGYNGRKYKSAMYVFAPVQEGSLGHRPGNQEEKERAYIDPLIDALITIGCQPEKELIRRDELGKKFGQGWIEPRSHTFMRGINLPEQVIIIDEAQNFTKAELKKILTRVHDSSLTIVIGHSGQCDLKNPAMSGFAEYIQHYSTEPYAYVGKFTKNFRGVVATHADKLK